MHISTHGVSKNGGTYVRESLLDSGVSDMAVAKSHQRQRLASGPFVMAARHVNALHCVCVCVCPCVR